MNPIIIGMVVFAMLTAIPKSYFMEGLHCFK